MSHENATPTREQPWLWGELSRLGVVIALATLIVDQAHKWWMIDVYGIIEKGKVTVTPFLDLVFVKNKGVSYGMFSQSDGAGQLMLAGFAAVVSIGMLVWLARVDSRLLAVSLGLLIGGALGNAIDRLRLGGVADFFSFHAYGFYWYVFNIADVAIVAGVAGLLYESLLGSREKAPNSE